MKTLKTLLIFLLGLTLAAAAFFTRPSDASFKDYLTSARPRTAASLSLRKPFNSAMSDSDADRYVQSCTVADRFLWVEIRRDGKTLFTGVFGQWFPHAESRPAGN